MSKANRFVIGATLSLVLAGMIGLTGCSNGPAHQTAPDFEPVWEKLVVDVQTFEDRQPTGVAVSSTGRVFVTFPWWADRPDPSVAELLPDGTIQPYPSASWNDWNGVGGASALRGFVCAQALYVDDNDHLWVLDAGNPRNGGGVVTAGPKLFRINLADDSIVQVFYFDHKRDFTTSSYLADFRVDTKRHVAYIADSARGSIYVVDLRTRETHAVLLDSDTTKANANVVAQIGSRPWKTFLGFVPQVNVSGLELSKDGQWLYYHAMTGRTLYRVPTAVLRDENLTDAARATQIENLGSTGSVIDGMWLDEQNNLFLAAIEKDAIMVRRPNGEIETFVADERLKWPDSLAMGPDGYLYFTTSMRHLRRPYNLAGTQGEPYYVMRASIDKVERAIAARDVADEAHALAAARAAAARQAEIDAQIAAHQARQQRLAAEAREHAAELAAANSQRAAATHQERVGRMETAAAQQARASEEARIQAELATSRAQDAQKAAEDARAAAEIARRFAAVAAEKAEELDKARFAANLSAEQAAQARRAHEIAMVNARAAEEAALQAMARANAMSQQARDAFAAAAAAARNAEEQAQLAAEFAAAARSARERAALAEHVALDAEYAELGGYQPDGTGIADVPTDTE
ncbi:MAG: L-dopachrome tautomerase-related protein [Planctomycetota bacterium]